MTILDSLRSEKHSEDTDQTKPSKDSFLTDNSRSAREKRKQVASWALTSYQKCKQDRSRQERQWYLNLAFYAGSHYARFRGTVANNFDLYTPNVPYYRVRPVINYTRKIIRKDIARLTSQKPNAYVVPASSDDSDLFAAQASEQVWSSLYHREKLNYRLQQSVFWAAVCGNGFIKQCWDETKIDPDNENVLGNIAYTSESPFHIFVPDLMAMDIEDQPFVIHAKITTPEYVKNFYGLESAPSNSAAELVDGSLLSVLGISQVQKDRLVLLEVHIKPGATDLMPEGGYFTLAGSDIISGNETPAYDHGEFPFSKIDAMPSGKFYNDSVIVDLIPGQRELNRTVGQVIEAKNRMAKPQLTAEEGSVDAQRITTEPGQVIFYRSGHNPPTPLPLQQLPSYVMDHIDRELAFMSDLAGQHEVTKGQVPPGVTAATAISYLQEADDSILSTMFDSVEMCMEKTARQSLHLVKEFWNVPRLVKVTGTDGTFDALMLMGSQLNDDIRIEGGSALPTSKAAKQAFIMDMMTRGFIDPEEGLSVMEMGGLNKIYDRIQVDIKQIQRENIKLKSVTEDQIKQHIEDWQLKVESGDPVAIDQDTGEAFEAPPIIPVNSFDNHEMHIEYHNRFRKSQAYEMLPDFTKALFEEHVAMHEEVLMQLATATQIQGANPLTPGDEYDTLEPEGEPGADALQPPGPDAMPPEMETF